MGRSSVGWARSARGSAPPRALAVVLGTMALVLAGSASALESPRAPEVGGASVVRVSATGSFTFVPSDLSVIAGAPVELEVTQEANFNHTFTLSSVAGYTFAGTSTPAQIFAFFAAHPPLVNLSLGDLPGRTFYANFTAPPAGAYEFLCEIPGHFQSGMFGTLTSSTGATSPSAMSTPVYLYAAVALAAIVVVAALLLLWRRRPSRSAPPNP